MSQEMVGPLTCKCGRGRHATDPGICASGHTWVGHGADKSRKHEIDGKHLSAEAAAIEADCRALFEQSLADAGGRDQLIARVVSQHENRTLVVQANIRKLARALEVHSLFDRRGRLRIGWISKLESLVNTSVALDRMLGLNRRAKTIPLSLTEALEREPEAR